NTPVATAPALVQWAQPGVPIRENLFYGGANGHLIELWFDGEQWNVNDHGTPAGVAGSSAAAAVTWVQAGGAIRANGFYLGATGNFSGVGSDGTGGRFNAQGHPAGTGVAPGPGAGTWTQQGVPIRENVFYQGANGNLIEMWFDGRQWNSRDHGKPAATAVAS